MAWGVFYRPTEHDQDSHFSSYIKEYNHPPHHRRSGSVPLIASPNPSPHPNFFSPPLSNHVTPRFKVPLSGSILDDPAFSPDPRTHPHFPLANAGSFRAPPPKPPHPPPHQSSQALTLPHDIPILQEVSMPVPTRPMTGPRSPPSPSPSQSPPPSSASASHESDSHTSLSAFTSPTVSSATSYPSSPKQVYGDCISATVSTISPNIPSPLPVPSKHAVPGPFPSPPLREPEPPSTLCGPPLPETLTKFDRLALSTKSDRVSLSPRGKKNVLRNGRMRNLVRRFTNRHKLDRIDELDETSPFGGSYHHDGPYEAIGSNLAELGPPHKHSDIQVLRGNLRSSKHKLFTPSSRSVQYQSTPRTSSPNTDVGMSLRLKPGQVLRQNTIYTPPASDIGLTPAFFSRRSDLLTRVTRPDHSRTQSLPKSLTRLREDPSFLDPSVSLQNQSSAPPRGPRIHYFGDNIPRIPNSPPTLPPPQYESASPKSSSSQSAKLSPPVPPNLGLQQTPATDSAVSAFPPRGPRHRVTHSLDNPGIMNRTQSSSSIEDRPLEPPRIRHLPKRLVMPAPLQLQLPEPRYEFPPVNPPVIYDEYPDDLSGSHFEGQPAMYNQGPNLLRKRTSAFPAKMPIPEHVPVSQGNAVPVIENSLKKADNEAERIKEGTRRRRLSKRKKDN